ncbi:MAG: ATP-binding protein [Oscillibacter sp.]|nr:ATP-binding protein [Oscillibacter sp.]
MASIILKSLSIKNFGPFAERINFTTSIDKSKKEHLENTFTLENHGTFNRISYVFGANGAGKSNFCKALIQIQKFINLSPLFAANNPQLLELQPIKLTTSEMDEYFLFDPVGKITPSEFSIEILMDGISYGYSFAVLDGLVISETLNRKKQRTETILSRSSPAYQSIELKSELASFAPNIAVVKERALCLSMAAFLNNPLASKLIDAIGKIFVLNMANLNGLRNITQEKFTEEIRKRCLNILKIAEPTMEDLSVKFTEEDVDKRKFPIPVDDLEGRELIIKNVRVDVQSTHSIYHANAKVERILLPFLKYESNGTIKMLNILPLLFQALETGTPIVIDEIDNGLHPNVIQGILNLFKSSETNPHNAQLICTTHSIVLAQRDVRRDQVWVVSKDSHGRSTLERISDYPGTRTTDNIAEKYLRCAFGDVPNFA